MFETTRPVDYLERLAASDLGRGYKALVSDRLAIAAGQVVLDLGCGPGADLPGYAEAAGDGVVLGVDHDPALLERARERCRDWPRVLLHRGDAHRLGVAAGSVDRAHTDRVLQHVAEPAGVLAETRRVLRPGGRAVFVEPDWHTLVVDHPDVELASAYTRFVCDAVVRNAAVGRQLPRLAAAAGFTVDQVVPVTAVFDDVAAADRVLGLARVTERAVAAGHFTGEQADRWLRQLADAPFLASATLFVVSVNRG